MATSVSPEIAFVMSCHGCGRPVSVHLTKTGKGSYACDGERQDDGAHCGFRATMSARETGTRRETKGVTPDPVQEEPPDDRASDGGDPEPPPGKPGGFGGLGQW